MAIITLPKKERGMWCQFVNFTVMLKKILYSIILLSTDKPTYEEKVQYLAKLIMALTPVAALMDYLGVWFIDNHAFFSGMIMAYIANMIVGGWYHKKSNTFKWSEFWLGNIKMWSITLLIYPLLEVMSTVVGDNYLGETFKVTIQIATLLYPISKVLKNGYILSNKKYPPGFIMERLYRFEKNGDVRGLFGDNENNNGDGRDNTGTN